MRRGVSVVAVTFNAQRYVEGMLASLVDAANGAALEMVVVDNGSADGTVEILRRHPELTVVEQRNTGYAHGLNRGISTVSPDHDVLILNPDVALHPSALSRLVAVLDEEPRAGIVVPRLKDADGRALPSLRREPSTWRTLAEVVLGGGHAGRSGEALRPPAQGRRVVDWATGAVMLIRREVLDVVGGFDESFFLYSEETEYCLRARDHGFVTICEPTAIATHVGGELRRSPQLWSLRAVNRVRLHRSRNGELRAAAFRAACVLFESRRALLGDSSSRAALPWLLQGDLDDAAMQLAAGLGGDVAPMSQGSHSSITTMVHGPRSEAG